MRNSLMCTVLGHRIQVLRPWTAILMLLECGMGRRGETEGRNFIVGSFVPLLDIRLICACC